MDYPSLFRRCWKEGDDSSTLQSMSFYGSIGGTPAIVSIVVGALIAWTVTKYYANKARLTKALGWTPRGISRIVTRPVTDVAKGLALTWNGEPLRTPYTVRIRISNAGTREVVGNFTNPERSDFIEPLVVRFNDSTCYEATVTDTHNVSLKTPQPIISAPVNEFEVPMPTLNLHSWIELEIIADGVAKYPSINCFLEGQTEPIGPVAGRQRSRIKSAMIIACGIGLFLLTIGFGLLGLFAYNPDGPGLGPPVLMVIGVTVAILATFGFVWAWVLDRQEWNAMKRGAPGLLD